MSLLVQISDPHFGTERQPVVAALTALVRAQKPSVLLLSGDITQRARAHQFAAAARFLGELGVPQRLVIPGNHDIPLFNPIARLCFPYANFARAFGANLEPEHDSPSLLVLCVKTTRRLRHTDGEVSPAQIERVARRLESASPAQLRIVVTHQPVHVIAESDRHDRLHGHAPAVRAWSAAGADLIVGGHIHLPYIRPLSDAFPDLPRRTWAVQAGTAVSRRVRGGISNSINMIRHDTAAAEICQVERWDYDEQESVFTRVEAHQLVLDRMPKAAIASLLSE